MVPETAQWRGVTYGGGPTGRFWSMCRLRLNETPSTFHYGGRVGQRTSRGQAPVAASSRMSGWSRYDLIAIDEVGYVPLAEVGAEFLFQVVAERTERPAVVLTTNLPFSEWTQLIPNY